MLSLEYDNQFFFQLNHSSQSNVLFTEKHEVCRSSVLCVHRWKGWNCARMILKLDFNLFHNARRVWHDIYFEFDSEIKATYSMSKWHVYWLMGLRQWLLCDRSIVSIFNKQLCSHVKSHAYQREIQLSIQLYFVHHRWSIFIYLKYCEIRFIRFEPNITAGWSGRSITLGS